MSEAGKGGGKATEESVCVKLWSTLYCFPVSRVGGASTGCICKLARNYTLHHIIIVMVVINNTHSWTV